MALTRRLSPTHRRKIDDPGSVGWLELFFDLVYVAALIQLGDRLADDVTWGGAARFAGAFIVLWWTWTGTTALVNRFAADDVPHRLLTFVQMFAVGNFAILASTSEVDDRSTMLVLSYVTARLPLLAMYWRARSRLPDARPIADLYLSVFSGSLVLWGASLLFAPEVRWWIWGVALVVEFAAPAFGASRRLGPPTHEHHFKERYALFTIIVLGETFVKSLSEITEIGVSLETQVLGGLAFVVLVALWWTYYDDVAESDLAERTWISGSGGTNRLVWVYLHLPLAMGLTAFGVAAKKVVGVEALGDPIAANYTWLLVAALVAVLVSAAVVDSVTVSPHFGVRTSAQVGLRMAASAGIVAVGAVSTTASLGALVVVGILALIVAGQIVGEIVLAARADRRVERAVESQRAGTGCEHLQAATAPAVPGADALTCAACDAAGDAWVQLRVCLTCGHVGCCDDSPGRHASQHHDSTTHPTIATLHESDTWAFCYIDDSTDPGWWDRHRSDASHSPRTEPSSEGDDDRSKIDADHSER